MHITLACIVSYTARVNTRAWHTLRTHRHDNATQCNAMQRNATQSTNWEPKASHDHLTDF